MPNKITYTITTSDGKSHQVSEDNIKKYGMQSYANAYKGATIRMRDKDGADYDIPLGNYNDAQQQGLHPFRYEHTPAKETAQQKPQGTSRPAKETDEPQKPWKPTPMQRMAFNMNAEQFKRDAEQRTRDFNERMDNLQEYGRSFAGGHTAAGGLRFNPQSKKMERTYLTPTGERTFNKAAADAVSREYRDAVDMTVGGQIRRAQNRLQELKDKAAARVQELHEKWKQDYENNDAPLAAVLAADTYVPSIQSDQTYRALQAAIRQTEEQIKTLGEQQDREAGKDVGFWRGFGRVAGDLRTWDFGIGDITDAMTMMNAANPKRPQTEQEKQANQDMLRATYENQQTEAMYGGNASFWNRAGMMTGHMPSFMLDFAFTGGGFEAINMAGKASTKLATKVLGKEAIEQMAELGFKNYVKRNGLRGLGNEAANWTIKALGTTADELLIRAPLMTNTVQGADTAADIIDRKLGDVTIDENGNYNFTNDKTWGSAIWQGEANSIVENYSEMFGAHLPEVASVKNLGRLANVIGAKRLGGVLAKADAGALGGITDGTRRIFQQMGVSDYLGEVSEEYYGQLWRTMLNLDDAYQQNPDGTRTNLFATKQFHGDIWGGMALSMGLMGAGKTTMSAANYLSMKHDVNKADARASELLTPEVWEPLRSTIDMATNDNVGDVAEVIVNDRDMTDEEKAAVMNYMERSLYLRGINLAELVKSRGGEQDENAQRANDSYMDGYNAQSDVEMQDARSMYELQRQKAEQALTPEELDGIDNDPIGALRNLGDDEAINQTVIDYINAKQVYDGMLQRVRDDIDGRIDQSNTMIDSRTNRKTGMIQGATLKVQDDEGNDRRVYVLDGNLATYEDGTGIDKEKSDGSIIIRDAETGAVEMVSPDAIFSVEQPVDPETEKQTAAEAIRQQFAQEAANRIDGTVAFQPGDTYTVTDESGQAAQIQIVPNADGLVDNGDGTVNVSSDGGQTVVPMRKEDIQAMVDATNRARVAQVEQQREAMQQPQAQEQPAYSLNDELTLLDENGNEVRGSITADANEDGQYEVYTENPINGRKVNLFTAEELNNLNANAAENSLQNGGNLTGNGGNSAENSHQENIATVNQDAINNATVDDLLKADSSRVESYYREHPEEVAEALATPAQATADYINGKLTDRDYLIALGYSTGENSWLDSSATDEEIAETVAENRGKYLPYVTMPQVQQPSNEQSNAQEQPVQTEQPGQSAMERIPKDEQGQPVYEQADPDTAWDAIVEQAEGDESMAQSVADSMVADKEAELKKVEKTKPKGGTTIAEKIAAERERKNAVEQAKANLALWQRIAQTSQRRRQAAMAEQSRQAAEAARLRREQEEQERAAREEAERISREALNGVPDFVDDTPQDARARGYRRVNGEKVDRQQSIPARQGKEVQVKFDDKNIPTGHVAMIEASQLQPSHLNGLRNPLHFIDEAQPKERNDDASVMSARKIAANIRPEEITSSVTAYTGAPTVNTRGEVIQGNNRSAALREMWAGQPEQAAVYKQYLTEHAADFGLAPEDVEAMQQPVLVNMVDVPDDEAISLGQFVAQDTESGGTERIKPKNIVQKMGDDMKGFAGRLLASPDEEMTFSELVDRNGMDVLKWMQAKNYITPTQYRSAFDSKGNLTGEAKNDIKGIMYQSIFQNGNTHLEEMFGALPAKAQKAILATAYRDYDSPNTERLNTELQNSISAYYALSQMPDFANSKNYKEARKAAEAWKRQLSFDDVTGESYLPSERYSNFAMLLATMYKGQTQVFIQNTLKNIFDLVQGTKEATLFEEPDNTPRTLVEAVNETMNGLSDELLLNENFIYNGQRRNNVLAGGSAAGQEGRQGGTGSPETGERVENGDASADRSGGTESDSGEGNIQRPAERSDNPRAENDSTGKQEYTLSDKKSGNGEQFYQDATGNIDLAHIPDEVFEQIGYTKAPFRLTPGMILHVLNSHGKELGVSSVDETIRFILDVMNNFDHVRLGYDGALIFSVENGRRRTGKRAITILINSDNGQFYGLKSSGYEAVNGLNKRPLLWERGAKESSSSADAATASVPTGKSSLSGEQSGSASHQSKDLNNKYSPSSSDRHLAEHSESVPDLLPTQGEKGFSKEVYRRHTTAKQPAGTAEASQETEQSGTPVSSSMVNAPTTSQISSETPVKTEPQQPNNAVSTGSSLSESVEGGITHSEPNGEPTVSESKDSEKSPIINGLGEKIAEEEKKVDTNPTEAQKEAGNYKKGHVRIGQFDVSIEQPKGSVRSGVDASGNKWETTMQNTYGYIRGTEGVDGDHIDVFLTNDIDGWNGRRVYIVDQYNEDGTFDEHKVMLGFNDEADAQDAYLSNYEKGWENKRKLVMTSVNLPDFEKWINSSHRKTKPFAEYQSVNGDQKTISPADRATEITNRMSELKKQADEAHGRSDIFEEARLIAESNELYAELRRLQQSSKTTDVMSKPANVEQAQNELETEQQPVQTDGYTVERRYHKKNGTYINAVKFTEQMPRERFLELKKRVKDFGGYYSSFGKGGFIFGNEEDAHRFAHAVLDKSGEELEDAKPLSLADTRKASDTEPKQVDVIGLMEEIKEKGEAKLSDHVISQPQKRQEDNNSSASEEVKPVNPSGNRLVTDERYEELKKRMKAKLGQLNVGIDPEIIAIGAEMAVYHIEKGARKFADYAKAMIADMGDVIRPYLKSFYNAVRDMPEAIDNGLVDDMSAYDEVRSFDVANFDKQNVDALATAELVAQEQELQAQADDAKRELTNQRNEQRRNEDEQTTADTEAIASQAEAIADEAERNIENATDEQQINEAVETINKQIEEVNKQLALLGYYEADPVEKDFNEAYGYMRNAEKKAAKDASSLAKRLAKDLGIENEPIADNKGKQRKGYFSYSNIAPAGGEIYIKLPLGNNRELEMVLQLDPDKGDNLNYMGGYMRIQNNQPQAGEQRWSSNVWLNRDDTYQSVLDRVRQQIKYHAPGFVLPEQRDASSKDKSQPKAKKINKKEVSLHIEGSLFDDLFNENATDVEQNNSNRNENEVHLQTGTGTAERERGHEPRQNEPVGTGAEAQAERLDGRGVDRRDTAHSRSDEERGRSVSRTPESQQSITEPKNTRNNHSERGENHAPTSVDARIDANIKAIELSQQLMQSGETATPEQMEVLRKFSGWGGLGKAFSDTSTSRKLQDLLGAEGYEQAVMSANSAYYTPAYVVDTLWDIAEQMGFKGGNILEGSAGIGNILGQMPVRISERSDIQAVEIDGTSGTILSLLYPDAKVDIQGFEQTRIPNGSVDLAITNVPFVTGLRVDDTTGDKDLSKKFHNIHDFCIAKNVRKLREGGIGIFISSNGTLDNSKKLRDWIVNEGGSDFVGAFRMNNRTFGGTPVTSDIIVIRKRVNGQKSPYAIDVSTVSGERTAEYDTGETRKVKGQEVPVVKQLAMDYNRYFIEHPENMAGDMRFAFEEGDTYRPTSKGLYPAKGKEQEKMLADFVDSFADKDWSSEAVTDNTSDPRNPRGYVMDASADGKKLGEMYVKDDKLVIASAGGYYPLKVNANKVKGHTKVECFNAYSAIKTALADVLEYQTNNESDKGLKPLLDRLNKAYDDFVATYGHFNKNTAIAFLRNDVDYPNVFSLEKYEEIATPSGERKQKFGKTDVFSKRVVEKEKEPTPTNVKDGIIASMFKFGRIDVPYIAGQLGEDVEDVRHDIIENGYGFEDPLTKQMEVSYQYLSGNVREKLRQAQENNGNGIYDNNIKALQDVLPMDIPAHLIDFTLGSSWVDPKLYEEYVKERTGIEVKFTAAGGTWFMKAPDYGLNVEKNRSMGVYSERFKRTIMGHTLIEAAIQNKTITVSQTYRRHDGTTETEVDKDATQACANKIDEIRQDFKEWARQKMQNDADMSARMERVYNDTFNNYVPMSIPDDFVPEYFGGASHKFKMRPHQGKAIVRGTMQPLMLAHEVGTGKTFTLISTAMEMRRLGTARKPMIVVQNATVGQFVASAKELYPNAKILTLEEADRSAEGRKNFYAKIRYNDWDMIVVPQSTFDFIPDSEERQMSFIQDKIEEKMLVLEQMKDADPDGKSMITRQAEREIEDLQDQLAELTGETSKKRSASNQKKRAVALQNAEVKAKEMLDRATDDVENFDDMGIDALLIDEAHEYKHLGFATAMQRGVKGVDPSYSKKSQGVFLKVQSVLEKNNGRNVIFATGTPISNTAAEIWTFMRYLMPADTMKEYGIYYFDDFVRNFGNIQQMLEFSTNGKYKENNRFAGYVNLPELVRIWLGVADIVRTRDAGGVNDKIPEMEGGKAQDIYLPQTRALRSIMNFVKSELEKFENMSGKEKKANSHIPLTMFGIAKAAAVDARLVQADAEDDPKSKTNEAVRQTLRSLKETADYKGTVAIFADNYQNKQSGFNLYEDIRNKLIAAGVPSEQIVVMKSGMTVKKKLEIFDKVNRGDVRVILGSTFTLGTGVNIQERLHTLIHLDAPNRPMDYTQRNGRILRQGNLHKAMGKPVRILRFGVEDSLDVTAYQRLKTKGAIADSIMNGKQLIADSMSNRVLEEDEDVFGDVVAQLSGSEYELLKNNAEKNVRKYESRKKQWEADQTYIHNAKPKLKALIEQSETRAKEQQKYLDAVKKSFPNGTFESITIGKQTFKSVDAMADFIKGYNKTILDASKKMKEGGNTAEETHNLSVSLGDYTFKVKTVLSRETARGGGQLFSEIHRNMTYSCPELGLTDVPVHQSLLRNAIDDIVTNVITGKDFAERVEAAERSAEHNRSELEQLQSRENKPFEYEDELKQAHEKLKEYSELMKKEMAEKEAKYAEMDASVDVAENITSVDDDDVMQRSGEGTLTDDELSLANDPVAKLTGKSTRTSRQRREFAERERERMAGRVQELAQKLHLDNVDIVTDASTLQGKRAKAKGFYSRGTGRITIVIPNHTSVYDVEQTLLHEAVAHYGLRQLFGEHFDTFLDNVFQSADEDVRRHIVELAQKHGWDFRTATEEYLASLAENTNFDNTDASWWQKIKELFLRMLHKIGFEDFSGVTLSDNELRYILWRSYENLAEPGRYRSILGEAEDVAKQNELKVGNYTVTDNATRNVAEGRDELYRDGDPEVHERTLARDRYEQRVKRGVYQTQEALQDSMLGLREAMEAILKGEGKKKVRIEDVDGFENAYLGENRLSSVNKAEADAFAHTLFKPLLDEVGKLAPTKEAREELTDYMMAKHGLERNRVMRQREKDKLIDASELSKDKPQPPTENDDDYDLKMDAYNKAVEDWNNQVEAELGDKFEAIDQRDFAGLTALTDTDNVADAEAEARIMVEDYESGHNTDTLWERTNAVSDATLSKLYESGMMSKATYDNIRSMYDYYIPLRGFDEKTGEETYAYLNSKNSAFNAPIKTAKGRKSKADDPFAYLQSMAESAIVQGNRNKLVKQKFLNFVLNHPSDLASVSDIWLKYDKVADEWQPVFPDNINADDTPEEVERKMQDFEDKMKELAKQDPDLYKHGKDTVNIPYRVVEKRDLRQHQIVVKRGGRDYVITINGNPRAAQALNGQTNPDNDMSGAVGAILKAGERINRELSALYTTRNPDFVVSNFIRDMLYSNSMMWIKESPNYALRFHRNFAKVNPVKMKMLLAKYRKNELDMSNDTERMFHQFMMNGGETGYSNMRDIEKHKNDIRREIRKAGGQLPIRKAWDLLAERLDEVNRGVENCARFAAFMTSREMGRTIDRSIYDAKEISVNFNKKGSGAKFMGTTGQTKLGNASAFMSGLGRSGFVFWNAAIQGTANFGRQTKRHPAKALTGLAAMFLLGAIVASLGYGDDDEDDKNSYWNLPEYVRRSNLLFRAGDQWISIPLPVEYRAVYGLGELMTSTLSGKEHFTDGELAGKIAGQVSQLLPLDFMEGGGGFKAFIPSSIKPFAEASLNTSWTGLPIYKDTPYNKDMPEWTKAYKSANKYLVDLSETLNEISGGDEYKKGWADKIVLPISRDIKFKINNPAQWEYVLNGYFGGISNTIDRLTKMGETIIGQREYDPKSFLVLNRILKNGDERTEQKAINNEYFKLQKEYENTKRLLRNYERDTDNGIFDYAEKIDFLYNSPEYERYEIFESYRPDIDDLYDILKEANSYGDKEEVKDIEAQLNELKKMMISDMNKTRK